MSATLALRKRIEAVIVADTGTGGLREQSGGSFYPDGAAAVQGDKGAYYERAPANTPDPHILYSITEEKNDTTNYEVAILRVTFTIVAEQDQVYSGAGNTGDFGYTKLDAVRDRLIALFGNATLVDTPSLVWTFSPMAHQARSTGDAGREGRQDRTDTEAFMLVASKTRSVPTSVAGILTGIGMNVSGTLFSANTSLSGSPKTVGGGATGTGTAFDVQAPYAFSMRQRTSLHDITFETDKFDRVTPETSQCVVSIEFLPVVSGTTIPTLPTGELKSLTLTISDSLTYTISSGSALVQEIESAHSVDGGLSRGRYMIHVNGTMTPNYGPL